MKKLLLAAGLGLASLVAYAENGGPDAFGYVYTRTNNPNAFSSIAATGTVITSSADDSSFTRNIGFNFSFYGQTFTQAFVSTNGLTSFLGANTTFTNQDFSTTNGSIAAAAFWDDLFMPPGTMYDLTRGAVGSREYVVEWNNVGFFPGTPQSLVTFQAIFREDGSISYYYPELGTSASESGLSATIGIRDTDSSANGRFIQNSFNSAYLQQGDVITYSLNGGTTGVPETGNTIAMLGAMLAALVGLKRRTRRGV